MSQPRPLNSLTHEIARELHAGGTRAEAARSRLRRTLAKNDGRIPKTAEEIGCSPRTLRRWLARDPKKLQAYAGQLRQQAHVPGPRVAA